MGGFRTDRQCQRSFRARGRKYRGAAQRRGLCGRGCVGMGHGTGEITQGVVGRVACWLPGKLGQIPQICDRFSRERTTARSAKQGVRIKPARKSRRRSQHRKQREQ